MIARIERNEAVGPVEWDRVVEVVGELMTEVAGLYPPRFRVATFPTDEQLGQLRGE